MVLVVCLIARARGGRVVVARGQEAGSSASHEGSSRGGSSHGADSLCLLQVPAVGRGPVGRQTAGGKMCQPRALCACDL